MDKIALGPMPFMSVMPTLLVGANVKGKANYMTAAWSTVACMSPPMVCVAINKARYTAKGIEENRTFSLNIPSVKQVVETDHCGLVSGAQEDKSAVFRSFYGKLKTAPMAATRPQPPLARDTAQLPSDPGRQPGQATGSGNRCLGG